MSTPEYTDDQIAAAQAAEGALEEKEVNGYHIRRILTLRCEVERLTTENEALRNQLTELTKQLTELEIATTELKPAEPEEVIDGEVVNVGS